MRTGSVATTVPADAKPLWSVRVGTRVSAPIVADGRLYAALVDEQRQISRDLHYRPLRPDACLGAAICSHQPA